MMYVVFDFVYFVNEKKSVSKWINVKYQLGIIFSLNVIASGYFQGV